MPHPIIHRFLSFKESEIRKSKIQLPFFKKEMREREREKILSICTGEVCHVKQDIPHEKYFSDMRKENRQKFLLSSRIHKKIP